MTVQLGLEALLKTTQEADLPDTREDIPSRVEHDMIFMALDRTEHWLSHHAEYLDKQFRSDMAIQARGLVKALQDCRDILRTDKRPRSGKEDEPEDEGD